MQNSYLHLILVFSGMLAITWTFLPWDELYCYKSAKANMHNLNWERNWSTANSIKFIVRKHNKSGLQKKEKETD